ncbi:citrate synthase [Mesorhizobium sp. M2D.F.Ca.ET.185.01.1.1]|uniref:citrate synthase n=2 Tax=Mesorhizobium TaxID=68287 RepID=UPI000FCA88AA|nr:MULTISPECIES: citrate synthase [unclassified Mesorhizobium]TGP83431.1 citrate synthase [bacterium M00.F.Ca.ET.227.01.1.1]TGP99386.1 citrate synthase [bacterium M00.F.Ca.ET.221.01.1.1]TGQ00116.1 citrate synthase [bacterium M00.F.Ca.ET.222.01.1.1]TGU11502.1 citrate synthase [bacterium M00.F.Ca.ET.163.01.1.1]TGU35101.1 citrate synthase [bacterium M00.F.Ca.ET.156.01.1.1]TGU51447.1 citrate synthase [bacterium M00.F.Ca.ET.146.01.1.1]TGV71515.1 citrate synthase [Mesorhizobium sp. M2D.F.Ca.ET.160
MTEWLTREQALERLNVRPQTLYAYVSRGRIGMKPDDADPRRSQYRADDIAALATRRERGRSPQAIAESAIAWGEPAITTSVSTVLHGRLIYRGKDAVVLSATATLEETAELLWASDRPVSFASLTASAARHSGTPTAFARLSALAAEGWPSLGRRPAMLQQDGATATSALAAALGAAPGSESVHTRLAQGWSVEDEGADLIRKALVLLADHELNASTFAARVAASTGAPVAACLLAGLATLTGPRHGGAGAAAIALVEDAERLGPDEAIARWLAHDRPLPGFGHPLYPEGDPRAEGLFSGLKIDDGLSRLRKAVLAATGLHPNIDFALAAMTRSLRLPPDAPFRLFALGRSIGWTAHAIEQVTSNRLIRPRARYDGPVGI